MLLGGRFLWWMARIFGPFVIGAYFSTYLQATRGLGELAGFAVVLVVSGIGYWFVAKNLGFRF